MSPPSLRLFDASFAPHVTHVGTLTSEARMTSSARVETVPQTRVVHHSALREGVIAGFLGATVVAAWFLGVDVVAGHPL
jgi:hypothetical protein